MRPCLLTALLLGCGRVGFDLGGPSDGPSLLDALDAFDATDGAVDSSTMAACSSGIDLETVALFTFEAGLGQDATGAHDAMVRGGVVGSAGICGATAAKFTTGAYLLVPSSPIFDLQTASIELHVRMPMPARTENQTVIARDASGLIFDGHFMLFSNLEGVLVARLQRGGASYYRCAPPITPDTWTHVGISVGDAGGHGLRMWVDHIEASLTTALVQGGPVDCTAAPPTGGLAGNNNTWVIGASNANAADGATDPLADQFMIDGAIDHVRIRSVTRDFSTP